MKNLETFNFSLIINLLFKELANEWINYAEEELHCKKISALDQIQPVSRVHFIYDMSKHYFMQHKIVFAQEIANTFIELIAKTSAATLNTQIIKDVLSSNLLTSKGVLVVHNYHSLWTRVREAQQKKKIEIQKLISSQEDSQDRLNAIKNKPLVFFDEYTKRVHDTMVEALLKTI